ncbi:FadR/GntR family transcriptional regulator [Pseudonocardia endophytica]|uniref:GntR family transcriptional regulator n=1 Tax=Pseudonocardia endophytica TaxID=401976 RepID=A0A4R1HJK0_PSEEN|nr:FCD domain-containing protein [Pseudonocardia endophytica]TCK20675.1 GntR family transcriptional regulator [Pseudonocardia endophytica]
MTGPTTDERVRAMLADGLRSGTLSAGSRLPTERSLVDQLGIGRTAVRGALAALEREGTIVRHVGRGTFVADTLAAATTGEDAPQTSPAEIMQTRLLLEPEIAALAATQATQADVDHLHHCLSRSEHAIDYADFEGWDSALHRGIATAAHNALLLRLFDTMNAARDLPVWGSIKRRTATPARRERYETGHRAIVDALTERDPDLAREHMRAHLLEVRTNLLGPH